ncbi:MAG TPA: DUF371 domain-containing protein [Acidimicrobiales bacterium]|jgi:hypothetical protein
MARWPRRFRVTGTGHPAVRATHDKTLEVTADPDLTERGTCILAVGADLSAAVPLAGPVRLTIRAGDHADTVTAVANPFAAPAGRLVVRRSDHADPDTFAGLADRGAADLDPDLADALRDPATAVHLDVVEAGDRPADNALLAVLPRGVPAPPGTEGCDPTELAGRLAAGAHLAIRPAGRGLDPFLAEVVAVAVDAGAVVAVAPGPWEVPTVLVAAGIATLRHVDAGTLTGRAQDETALLALAATAGLPLAARCQAADLPDVAARLAEHLGSATPAAVAPERLTPYRTVRRATVADLAGLAPAGAATVAVAVAPPPAGAADHGVPVAVDRLLARLVDAGVPVRTLAAALAGATGLSRRQSYDHVLQRRTTEADTDRNRG